MWPLVAFSISGTALVACIVFKLFQRSHSLPRYEALRAQGDVFVMRNLAHLRAWGARIEEHLSFKNVVVVSIRTTAVGVLHTARAVEKRAHKIVHTLAHPTVREGGATRSSFLQEVSTHKKGLDTERIKRETSMTSEGE